MREKILELFKTLPATYAVEDRGSSVWMCCPVHSEKMPSFKVSLEPPFIGSHYCFGCRTHGNFSATLKLLGLKGGKNLLLGDVVYDSFSQDEEDQMLGRSNKLRETGFREHWPQQQNWRGVPGKLIAEVGGSLVLNGNGREPLLRLPVMVRGTERGYIDCKVNPEKGERLKYWNSKGSWALDVLYPYDYVKQLNSDKLVIVEGPRDALITLRNGMAALALLGATSWSEKCINLVMALGPSIVILLLDPDHAGELAMKAIYKDLSPHLHVLPIMLPSRMEKQADGHMKRIKLIDPADLSSKKLKKVLNRAGVKI